MRTGNTWSCKGSALITLHTWFTLLDSLSVFRLVEISFLFFKLSVLHPSQLWVICMLFIICLLISGHASLVLCCLERWFQSAKYWANIGEFKVRRELARFHDLIIFVFRWFDVVDEREIYQLFETELALFIWMMAIGSAFRVGILVRSNFNKWII